MKAKDIALLCAGAVSAGAFTAGAVISAAGKGRSKADGAAGQRMPKPVAAPSEKKAGDIKPFAVNLISFPIEPGDGLSTAAASLDGSRVTAVFTDGTASRGFAFTPEKGVREIRCPSKVYSAAYAAGCTLYISDKGGIFVYDDPDKEPVLREFCSARNVYSRDGHFEIFSDGMMYTADTEGETVRTFSLSGMYDITESDICDAENSDDNFSDAGVSVKRSLALNSNFTAALTEDGRSFLIHEENGFPICENAYENIADVCVHGKYAYWLTNNNMLIKMKIMADKCETEGRYSLGSDPAAPVSVTAAACGLVIVYSDGSIRPILPEINGEKKKAAAKDTLRRLGETLSLLSNYFPDLRGGAPLLLSDEASEYVYAFSPEGRAAVIHIC